MRDTDHLTPGNEAHAGTAADRRDRSFTEGGGLYGPRIQKLARVVTAGAAGTSSPLHRSNYAVATNRGYGEAMGRGFELALTLVVMGGLGWGVDRLAGTYPLFVIIFSVIGFAGITVKLFVGYDLEMRKHEQDAIWNRSPQADDAEGNRRDGADPETMAS